MTVARLKTHNQPMRSKFPYLCAVFLSLTLAASLPASDPLGALWPEGLGKQGFELALQQHAAERALWYGDEGQDEYQPAFPPDANGAVYYLSQKQMEMTALLRWQASPRWLVEWMVPYSFIEYSPYTGNAFLPFSTNDPRANFGDAWGDLQCRIRYFSPEPMGRADLRLGFMASVSAPTCHGPFSASHPYLATGAGTWQFQGGFMASQRAGVFKFWQQVSAVLPLGYPGTVPPGTLLTPDHDGIAYVYYPAGSAWIKPAEVYTAVLGIFYDFYRGPGHTLSLGTELTGSQSGKLALSGVEVGGTDQKSLGLLPQFNIEFATHFNLQGGLLYPLLLVRQLGPAPFEPVLRAGYVF